MSNVARFSRFLLAVFGAVVILMVGLLLFHIEVIHDPSVALWPTYGLLHLNTVPSVQDPSTWFPLAVHVFVWTVVLYAILAVAQRAQRR
jgi:hypothetical protein